MQNNTKLCKKVYLYGRLSNEDEMLGDSVSIENQRMILIKYAVDNGFENCEFIYDDGYSGYDINRPVFTKMIEEVEAGNVSTIIVKDLSRFNRHYKKSGYLLEELFPKMDVRFISIHENIDTAYGLSKLTAFLNIVNEWYVQDCSEKIRAVQQAKGKTGKRLAVIPPYGYRKDPETKQLIIDEESASVVRRIFQLSVDGFGPSQIARTLNSEYILNPSAYKFENGIMKKQRPYRDKYFWNITTIQKILDAPEYLGHTINFKTWSKSYRDSKSRFNPPEKRLIFENTHPAIIDIDTWKIVRDMREHKHRPTRYGIAGLFSGIVYCSDCGSKLYYRLNKIHNKAQNTSLLKGNYSCSQYSKQYLRENGQSCSAHYIAEASLVQIVIEELREMLGFVKQYERQFVRLVMDKSTLEQQREIKSKRKMHEKYCRNIKELDTVIEKLYFDNALGKISNERYESISASFESEQAKLKETVYILENEIRTLEFEIVNIDSFLGVVQKYTDIQELTPSIIHEFIDRIIIYEPEKARGNRQQKVEIIYRNVGVIDFHGLS